MKLYSRIISLPLRLKLILPIVLIGAIFVLSGSYVGTQYTAVARPISMTLAETITTERAHILNTILGSVGVTVGNLANNDIYSAQYAALRTPNGDAARLLIQSAYNSYMRAYPQFMGIRFVTADGQVVISTRPLADTDDRDAFYFDELRQSGGLRISDLLLGATPRIEFAVSSDRSNQRLGYVVVTLDPSVAGENGVASLLDALRPEPFEGGTLNFYLVKPDGGIESPFFVAFGSTETTRASAQRIAALTEGEELQYISPLLNREVRGYALPIPGIERVLVAEAQIVQVGREDEAGQFLVELGALTIGALLVLAGVFAFFEWTVVVPLRRLTITANRAAQGQPILAESLSDLARHDEIGTLNSTVRALTSMAQRDIKLLEARVSQRTRDLEATRDIGQAVSSIRDLDPLLRQVVELIRDRFEYIYHAQVFLIDVTRQFAVLRVSTGEVGEKLLARGHRLAVGSQSVIGRCTADGQSVVALDTSSDPVHRMNELLPETRAELALPLRTREGIIGALDLQSKVAESFSEADIRLFQGMADQLAVAIANAQLFQNLETRLTEIEELNRRITGEAWRGYEVSRRRALTGRGRGGQRFDENWSDLQRRAVEHRDLVEQFDTETVTFAVPVMLRDQVFGAVEWVVPVSSYHENTRLLARDLAARLAVTADNARLLEQSQRLADRERLVNDIAAKLTRQTEVDQILQLAVRELGQALRVPQTSIRLATMPEAETDREPREQVERKPE